MSRKSRDDYYREGRHDGENHKPQSTPHEGFFDKIFSGQKEWDERKSYDRGFEDGKKKR